jgi:hypothetical protein
MKNFSIFLFICVTLLFSATNIYSQTTIEQWLDVVRNDEVVGGELHVAIKVKGTDLTAANTVGTVTIDIIFSTTQLSFLSGDHGVIQISDGYFASINDNTTFIRYGALPFLVGDPGYTGYDLSETYVIFCTLKFTILDDQNSTDIVISQITNQIGLFDSHANENGTGEIDDQTLSPAINISEVPLPVELISFSANYAGSKVSLEWQTATEVNNYGFQVERKTVEEENAQWKNVGFVAGEGNSNKNVDYVYFDEDLNSNHYVYRLKQIDNDGSFTFSDEVEVKFDLIEDFTLTQNYPNPFNPSTQIKFGFKESTQASLRVYNTIGELVAELFNAKTEAGNLYTVIFNADNLTSGMYLYELRGNNSLEVKKMLLLK